MDKEPGDKEPAERRDETSKPRPDPTPPARAEAEQPKGQPSSDRYESEAVIDQHSGQ